MKKFSKENYVIAINGIVIGIAIYLLSTFLLAYGIYTDKIPEEKIKIWMMILSGQAVLIACMSIKIKTKQPKPAMTWAVVLSMQAIILIISAVIPGAGDRKNLYTVLPSAVVGILCSNRINYRKRGKHHKYC